MSVDIYEEPKSQPANPQLMGITGCLLYVVSVVVESPSDHIAYYLFFYSQPAPVFLRRNQQLTNKQINNWFNVS